MPGKDFDASCWEKFAAHVYYHAGDIGRADDFKKLAGLLSELEGGASGPALLPCHRPPLLRAGHRAARPRRPAAEDAGVRRVVIEKPFGTDLATAQQLNEAVHQVFREKQVYRIDHYLGKETVQNLLVLRFANTIFEPVWNRNYIDHVQITVAEEVDVGKRAGYYDSAGVVRDMVQNHLLQLLMITAMEPPVRYEADAIRNEKVKVLHAVRPFAPSRCDPTRSAGSIGATPSRRTCRRPAARPRSRR